MVAGKLTSFPSEHCIHRGQSYRDQASLSITRERLFSCTRPAGGRAWWPVTRQGRDLVADGLHTKVGGQNEARVGAYLAEVQRYVTMRAPPD